MSALGVAIIEDDARYRRSVELLVAHTEGLALAGSFASPRAALATDASSWDVALVDVDLPGMTGIELTRRLKAQRPDLAVLILTVFEEPGTMLQAICAGADGYLLKRSSARDLVQAIRAARTGGAPLTAPVARGVLELVRRLGQAEAARVSGPERVDLSAREREVLRCLVDGRSYQETATALAVQLDTVRTHVRNLYRKLQVNRAAEAVARALRDQLV